MLASIAPAVAQKTNYALARAYLVVHACMLCILIFNVQASTSELYGKIQEPRQVLRALLDVDVHAISTLQSPRSENSQRERERERDLA